jgi:hypothetical protein
MFPAESHSGCLLRPMPGQKPALPVKSSRSTKQRPGLGLLSGKRRAQSPRLLPLLQLGAFESRVALLERWGWVKCYDEQQ